MAMRKTIVVLLLAFVLVIIAWVFVTQSVMVLQRVANVSQIQGQVSFIPKGQAVAIPLTDNDKVKEGDVVQTGPASSALLTWVDGSKVQVGPESRLEVKKCFSRNQQEVSLFRLDTGQIWSRISKRLRRESRFEVETPVAVAGVRGTIFSVAVIPSGGARISVLDGSVLLRTTSIESFYAAGIVVEVDPAGKTSATRMDKEERAQWGQRRELLGPLLTVFPPERGEPLPTGPTRVTGQAEPGASVVVNGRKAAINHLGRFSVEVPLVPGENSIEIRATDRFGYSTVIKRVVVAASEGQQTD